VGQIANLRPIVNRPPTHLRGAVSDRPPGLSAANLKQRIANRLELGRLVTPAVFAAGSSLDPITALTIRELIRRTGDQDRRRYQGYDRRFEKQSAAA